MSDIKEKYRYVIKKVKDLDGDAAEYEDATCIGLTEGAGRYEGVIYKYGKVSIPDENDLDEEGSLPFRNSLLCCHYLVISRRRLNAASVLVMLLVFRISMRR